MRSADAAGAPADRPFRTGYQIVDALNAEWAELDHDHRGVVAGWVRAHDVLERCGSFGEVLAAVERAPDAVRFSLLTEVGRDDRWAARVLLQSMLGRLVVMARRDLYAGVDEYVAEMWCRIWTYPLARRPERIAANLALDTLKGVRQHTRWLRYGEVSLWPPHGHLNEVVDDQARAAGLDHNRAGVVRGASVLEAATELEVIGFAAAELLHSVYLDGLGGAETARRHGTSAGSVRTRCSKAIGQLAAHAGELAAAA